jgi:hypothetical protein
MANYLAKSEADGQIDGKPRFTEHHIRRDQGGVYAREYEGAGPPFVLMHGFALLSAGPATMPGVDPLQIIH